MAESSEEEESLDDAPVEKKNYKLPKRRRYKLGRQRTPQSRQKRLSPPVGGNANGNKSNPTESTREPLRRISPNASLPTPKRARKMVHPFDLPSSSDDSTDEEDVMMKKNRLAAKTPEEVGEMMGFAALELLPTEEECVIAGKMFMDIVTGKFVDVGDDSTNENIDPTTPLRQATTRNVRPTVIELPNTPTIDFTSKAFYTKKITGEARKPAAARKAKQRAVQAIDLALDKAGTPAQQVLAVVTALQKPDRQPVGKALGLVVSTDITRRVADRCLNALKKSLKHPSVMGNATKDSISFQQTVLWAISPTAAPDDASTLAKKAVRHEVTETATVLGILKCRPMMRRLRQATVIRRDNFINPRPVLLRQYNRVSLNRFTPQFVEAIRKWIIEQCDKIIESPNARDSVMVKCPVTGVKKKERKYFYMFAIREIHNELIKPVDRGGFAGAYNEKGELIISDTSLRSILPKNITRMNESQKQMCGCEICLNAFSIMLALNSWRGRKKSYWEVKVDTAASFTPSIAFAKRQLDMLLEDAYPNGQRLWNTAQDAMYSVTCGREEGSDLVRLRCALGRCRDCPPLKIVRVEQCEEVNTAFMYISWSQFETFFKCKRHGIIDGSKCAECLLLPADKRPDKKPASTMNYANKRAPIGTFIKEIFNPFLVKLRYHIFLVTVLGKNHCVKDRAARYMRTPTGRSVLIHRDYSDRLNASYNGEAQSQGMGEKPNTGMEGITVRYFANGDYSDEDNPETLDWHVYMSDEKQQDARTSMVNTEDLIQKLQKEPFNLLPFGKDSVMYEQSDGCAKQYKCGTALWAMSLLAHKYRIGINRMVTAPHHGKGTVDALAGIDKNYIRNHFRAIRHEGDESRGKKMESYTVDRDGKEVSFAQRCCDMLNDKERQFGVKSARKSNKREEQRKVR